MSPTLTPSNERLNFQLHRDVGMSVAFELRLDVRDLRHAASPVVALCYRHLRAVWWMNRLGHVIAWRRLRSHHVSSCPNLHFSLHAIP